MKIFSAEQIRNWDVYTILHEPIASIDLMERAAVTCYDWIRSNIDLLSKKSIKIFCAKGNNGGDGLVIARKLLADGYSVAVYILEFGNKGTDDFQINLQRLHTLTTDIHFIQTVDFFPIITKEDLIIDAIFGTGLNKPIQGVTADLIQHINQSKATVVAIDIPSGMYTDKTSKDLLTIKANHTLSFQTYKKCFLMAENEEKIGYLSILDIGLHKEFEINEPTLFTLLEKKTIQQIYRPRNKFAHKGNYGHALIMAGSYGKMGAAVLASKACLRTGVGLLSVHVPEIGYSIIQTTVPEAMTITHTIDDYKKYTAIGIGPGLGTTVIAKNLITDLFKNSENNKLVFDADALNMLSVQQELLAQLPSQSILTPHPKEFERLFGKCENDFQRMETTLQKAAQHNCFIVLKGHHSFIATPNGKGYFNNTGNSGMATGGSGDVLTGILTGLLAQGYTAEESCLLGVYLHGLAGDIAAEKLSQEAMIAGDIIEFLGDAFKTFNTQ